MPLERIQFATRLTKRSAPYSSCRTGTEEVHVEETLRFYLGCHPAAERVARQHAGNRDRVGAAGLRFPRRPAVHARWRDLSRLSTLPGHGRPAGRHLPDGSRG